MHEDGKCEWHDKKNGDFLKQEFDLTDYRGDPNYQRWDEDYLYYLDFLETIPLER